MIDGVTEINKTEGYQASIIRLRMVKEDEIIYEKAMKNSGNVEEERSA